MKAASIKETLSTFGGQYTAFIGVGVSTATVKTGKGRLCRISITTAGTTSLTVFDSLTGSGNVLFVTPATTSVGQIFDIQLPAETGLTVVNTATGPAAVVSFD